MYIDLGVAYLSGLPALGNSCSSHAQSGKRQWPGINTGCEPLGIYDLVSGVSTRVGTTAFLMHVKVN